MGFHLGRDFLLLDITHYSSFRFKEGNFNHINPLYLYSYKNGFDKEYMDHYFHENEDNPYAIQFVMNMTHRSVSFNAASDLTKFPPLFYRKPLPWYKEACDRLLAHAEVGDSLFSYDRRSRISKLIRRIDNSPWSHTDTIHLNKEVVGMTVSGYNRNNLAECFDPSMDIALYRYKGGLTEEQKVSMALYIEINFLSKKIRFAWRDVIKIFLKRNYGLFKNSCPPSVSDLIYSNNFQLIDYC
ncbi:MAG: hypothetical protein ABSA44_03280 [Bacteroidota bacterium]|jgi:hypothetical protein